MDRETRLAEWSKIQKEKGPRALLRAIRDYDRRVDNVKDWWV